VAEATATVANCAASGLECRCGPVRTVFDGYQYKGAASPGQAIDRFTKGSVVDARPSGLDCQ